jgi:endonuclease III
MHESITGKILKYYKKLSHLEDYPWIHWTETRRRFTEIKANKFFVSVMLDQGQKTDRAWKGGDHLVENYFCHKDGFWNGVSESTHRNVTKICQRGYDGTSYTSNRIFNKFPSWLISAADRMFSKYNGDPRNIWAVTPGQVSLIYDRLKEFDGIGDALAKMGQFLLVRSYGVGGGLASQHLLAIKPDTLVSRVMYRTGISPTTKVKDVIDSTGKLCLKSPADFDAASWMIGRDYCKKSAPKCTSCPISGECAQVGLS